MLTILLIVLLILLLGGGGYYGYGRWGGAGLGGIVGVVVIVFIVLLIAGALPGVSTTTRQLPGGAAASPYPLHRLSWPPTRRNPFELTWLIL